MKRSTGENVFAVFNYVTLAVLALTTLYPFVYNMTLSLSTAAEAAKAGFHIYPKELSFTAYKLVFKNQGLLIAYGNTLFRTVVGTVLTLLVTNLFAFALSRPYLPFRRFLSMFLLFTMLFGGGRIPDYLLIKKIGLLNNVWVYILPGLIAAYNVIIARTFYQGIPSSLIEAAKIDGAGEFGTYFKIVMPISMPVIMTLALWVAVAHWNAWFDAAMYITDNNKIVVQALLQRIIMENNSDIITQIATNADMQDFTPTTVKAATIIVSILPILLFYPFIQKYFIKGVMLGAVKG